MQSPQAKLKQVRRILALWPSQVADEGEELLRAYLLAVEDYPVEDVERGVDQLVKGTAPGVSPSFRPKPPETGAECRRQMNLRLDRENREKKLRPALPPPSVKRTPEDRAKVKAMVDDLVQRTTAQIEAQNPKRPGIIQRANAAFMPDLSDEATLRRLNLTPYYSSGDPEGAEDAA